MTGVQTCALPICPAHSSPLIERIHADYRKEVPFIDVDTYMHPLIVRSAEFIREKQYI